MTIDIGRARVTVRGAVDASVLAVVLDVLGGLAR